MKGRKMRLPNGYGGVVKLSGNRRRPYAARITTGWHINDITGKRIQHYQILGYAPTRSEALQILARYNNYPIDGETLKLTSGKFISGGPRKNFPPSPTPTSKATGPLLPPVKALPIFPFTICGSMICNL